mmetsp:Transcript_18690/g.47744  ORF Transcript_18690/g.47744 Transcript_18690/m.47744 type:complete len:250 (+) Transcript_18690:2965-3714(+)
MESWYRRESPAEHLSESSRSTSRSICSQARLSTNGSGSASRVALTRRSPTFFVPVTWSSSSCVRCGPVIALSSEGPFASRRSTSAAVSGSLPHGSASASLQSAMCALVASSSGLFSFVSTDATRARSASFSALCAPVASSSSKTLPKKAVRGSTSSGSLRTSRLVALSASSSTSESPRYSTKWATTSCVRCMNAASGMQACVYASHGPASAVMRARCAAARGALALFSLAARKTNCAILGPLLPKKRPL